ncbi:hypothetical protein BZG36_04493 [Bifiguratus adelaidae]|uniref:J domain-containing protein n=1 Tax=Bifiguratus adelaidae TaxID=1938954 RepID=A0A261XYQ4_9FUNG|nr:hypothetical protein BZG36_04493 [Bifiguratus adelaidae]
MSLVLDFLLPPPPAEYGSAHTSISVTQQRLLEPVGPGFHAYARRKRHNRTFSEDERHMAEQKAQMAEEDEEVDLEDEEEDPALLSRTPQDWKTQDNYAILGLSKLRYKATEEQIKKAHRRKVLKHHPDKKADKNDDAFFKCIGKAYDTLMDPVKRHQYDSVDFGMEEIDAQVPSRKSKGDFFKLWGPVFEREGRFSNRQLVPSLGTIDSPREEMEAFYDFFYNFDSWRSFEWLDKEEIGGDNRDDKRYQEKKNKAQRAQLKKEDNQRLRELVDTALSLDPRVQKYKAEEKERRNAKKNAREAEAKKAAEEKARKAEEERLAKEKAEAEAKASFETAKKEKEAAKKAMKAEKKVIREIQRENNYCQPADTPATAAQVEKSLNKMDAILGKMKDVEELKALRAKLEEAVKNGNLPEVFEGLSA